MAPAQDTARRGRTPNAHRWMGADKLGLGQQWDLRPVNRVTYLGQCQTKWAASFSAWGSCLR